MSKALLKNTFREIKNSKARFISIMAIIALGVGFFAGIKATAPSMYNMAVEYYADRSLMDFRLVSTVGFDRDDIDAVSELDGVTSVMPSYYADLIKNDEAEASVVRVIALPTAYEDNEALNTLELKEGRLPEKSGEILVEYGGLGNSGYKIGDTVTFDAEAGDNSAEDMIKRLEYTIVGMAQSPLYISYQRGSTNIGSGDISSFMYILPDDFAFERYTELYVKTESSDGEISPFSVEYADETEAFSSVLGDTADLRVQAFNTDVIGKAEKELEDAKTEYASQKAQAEQKLDDAKKDIENAQSELDEKTAQAQSELDSALVQLENAKSELSSATDEYYSQIEAAEGEISSAEAELGAGRKQYNSSKEEYTAKINRAQAELEKGQSEYNTAYEEYVNTQKPELLDGIAQAQQAVDYLNNMIWAATDEITVQALSQQLVTAQETLEGLNAQLEAAEEELSKTKGQLDAAQAELDTQKSEGQAQLDLALATLEDSEESLNAAKAQLEAEKAEGYAQLAAAQSEIDSAQQQYDSGKSELEQQKTEGQEKIDGAWEEYDRSVKEAENEFAEAEAKIEDAQEELDSLSSPEWYVFDRDDNPGYSAFSQNADRLDAVASVFPVFFLLVAVLVCVTTMSRLIEEKRTEIGTLKALGYGNFSVIMKFVIYALLAGLIGCAAGIIIGVNSLPYIIYNAYKTMYYMSDISLVINVPSVVIAILAAIVCTVCVSVIVCMKSLHSKPAAIMRPKAPKAGKRIMLERIKPLWSHMGFTSKLTARNLFRYKSRLFMTVIGVAGCTALIVAAFGLKNSFVPLTHDQFEDIFKYNTVAVPKASGTAEELEYLTDILDENENIESYALMYQQEVTVSCKGQTKDDEIYLSVMENPDEFDGIISLRTRKDKTPLTLSDDCVMLNEKLAEELSVNIGDKITVEFDEKSAEVTVGGIYEQYINNYIFMTPDMYENAFGEEVKFNLAQIILSDTSGKAKNEFGETLLSDSRITAVTYVTQSVGELDDMLESLNLVVLVMIICAAALAFVVLYNLSNINIAERVREIATFKVLGFYHKETSQFIYRENIVLTVLGIALGLVLGNFLTAFIVQTVEVDNIMFGRDIFFTSYLYAAGLTALFAFIVNFAMSFKVKAVNMVESLKSIE